MLSKTQNLYKNNELIANLSTERPVLKPSHTIEKTSRIFLKKHELQSLPVVYKKKPVGIVYRHQIMDIFFAPYGRELFAKKHVIEFMDNRPLIVEQGLSLEIASQYIVKNMPIPLVQDFIITDGGFYKGIGTVLDLLEHVSSKKIEQSNQALIQKVQELEQRSAELALTTIKSQAATEEAIAANKTKSYFLAKMSHELRTPLNAIIGYSQMLQEDAEELSNKPFSSDLRKIEKSGKHLLNLICDILDFSKIEAGKMEFNLEKFKLSTMFQDILTTMQPLMIENNNTILIKCDYEGTICADFVKVSQCLLNLLSNATKFSINSQILLRAYRKQNSIIFSVRDYGIGMSNTQISKLFSSFTQADNSTSRQYGGTGLGLTITKQFCEMMGGKVSVKSELGKGSTFTIQLPLQVKYQ